ncbi:MAG: c-type cytochrome [Gammaproteobacteria bacterium]|nr:c-type cytochrome [Gammaproteobacteria bacterium]MBI5618802.1 c-type cytochrome [Gammaproteobacteria bacterium]
MRCPELACLALIVCLAGCERETRHFTADVPGPAYPGPRAQTGTVAGRAENPYARNAYAVNEGKRLFRWYNCNGCHAEGGGGMGVPLMDAEWRYGDRPVDVFTSIHDGRPDGMPAFGGRVTDDQIWRLAAYVRAIEGRVASATAPNRDDSLQEAKPETRRAGQ